jgi:pSer/pThr/pTyr-binding forkhead associated (FHA) protein
MPALIVKDGPSAGHRIEVAGEVVFGRADSEFLQHDTEVSRRHAVVRPEPGGLAIEDLGSSNGTFVNEQRIEGATSLNSGDIVQLGQTTFEVEIEPAQQRTVIREAVTPPAEPAPAPEPDVTAPVEPVEPAEATPMPPSAGPVPPPVQPPPEPAQPQAAYAPPPAPPAYGPAQAAPPGYGPPPGAPAFGVRTASVTAAAIILIIVGLGSIAYNGYDVVQLFGDLEILQTFGLGGLVIGIIIIDIIIIVSAVLLLVGGIRVFGLSRAGRTMGIIGCVGVVVGWIAFVVWALSQQLSVTTLAWVAMLLSVAGSVVALILLLGASRSFAPRY